MLWHFLRIQQNSIETSRSKSIQNVFILERSLKVSQNQYWSYKDSFQELLSQLTQLHSKRKSIRQDLQREAHQAHVLFVVEAQVYVKDEIECLS